MSHKDISTENGLDLQNNDFKFESHDILVVCVRNPSLGSLDYRLH